MSAHEVNAAAQALALRIALAESSAGVLISAALLSVPGASASFDRGVIAYSNSAKEMMLGVTRTALAEHGAVSEVVAQEMAEGMLRRSEADIALAETGIIGPSGSDYKPIGRVCFALARVGEDTVTATMDFGSEGREQVRDMIRDHALWMLAEALKASA